MKRIDISKSLINSMTDESPVKTYAELKTKFGCTDITMKRNIQRCNLLASINRNSKFYTLSVLAQFNRYGIWEYRGILFSRYGNLYDTLIHLVDTSKRGYTTNELSVIIKVKASDALRILCKKNRLQRQKYGGLYVYYSIDAQCFERQKANRQLSDAKPQTHCLPDDKNIVISVLVEIIQNDTKSAKTLHKALKKQNIEVSESQINSILVHYDLKKKIYK